MARAIQRLSDKTIKGKKVSQPGLHADGDGLYLRVGDGGAKSWIFRFKQKNEAGKFVARDMGLGGYPAVSLADAREKAKEAREHRDAGRNPIKERKTATQQQRLADARGITFRDYA